MDFSGTLNWGDIVAQILLYDVVLNDEDGSISNATVELHVNSESTSYRIAPM